MGFCHKPALLMVARRLQEFRCHVQKQEKVHFLLVSLGVRSKAPESGEPTGQNVVCPFPHQSLARRRDHHGWLRCLGLGPASPKHIVMQRSGSLNLTGAL